ESGSQREMTGNGGRDCGERNTGFFLGLEKVRQKGAYLRKIRDGRGEVCTETVEVMAAVQSFYERLFRKQGRCGRDLERAMASMSKVISREGREDCDRDLSLLEVEGEIGRLKANKSPGVDGLPAEFYQAYKRQVSPILLEVFRGMERLQQLPPAFAKGVITLIYKNKGERERLENYRPISLLNTDYKILARILATRLQAVAGEVVSKSQTYSIPGRSIADSILTVRSILSKMTGEGGILLSIDLEKAFDRVEHGFLQAVLGKCGLGERFRAWVDLLYRDATSCVKCNGMLTDSFRLERSVRQGCPLSPLLYALAAEPLAAMIEQDGKIVGIQTPRGRQVKLVQFADDISIMVKDSSSVERVVEILKIYEGASGAKVNMEKSEIRFCGPGGGGTGGQAAETYASRRMGGVPIGGRDDGGGVF
uniref:Reverse transcriptase domain-containing protein n=1 Tax=Mastacembelus armatus TaxID=205130 RepID=A0A7N8WYI6_9TELE